MSIVVSATDELAPQAWRAPTEPARASSASELRIECVRGRSVVTHTCSRTPLRLLAPRSHGHAAWIIQSSHGGGFVGADDVSLKVDVGASGNLFLSSQSTTKVFRGADARSTLDATVGDRATLVLWPEPLVCFRGASFTQHLAFHLDRSATLVCVDSYSAGRVARGERWAFDRLSLRLSLEIDKEHVLEDAVLLTSKHGALVERCAPFDAFATVVLAGPDVDEHARQLHATISATAPDREGARVVSSEWPWGVVLRAAASDPRALTHCLHTLLRPHVRGLLGDDPWERKW